MDRFGPTGKVSKKRVHLLRWSSFFGRTDLNFGRMDRALSFEQTTILINKQVGIQKDFKKSIFSESTVSSLHKSYNEPE